MLPRSLLRCFRKSSVQNLKIPSGRFIPLALNVKHSSSTSNGSEKLYELRVYSIWPENFKSFLELTSQWIHLRTAHSTLTGYWYSEIGGINDVVHIWEYDNLKHRSSVRQALASDPHWIASYFSKILPWMSRQDNMLLKSVGDCKNLDQPDLKGIYELEITQTSGRPFPSAKGDALLLGSFQGILGPAATGYQLWFHNSLDDVVANQVKGDNSATQLNGGHRRLLLPTPWSPLQ